MTTFVLVHGAYHGAWCWRRMVPFLRAHGHDCFTPTLTGLGERRHLLSPAVTLETHILDVANTLIFEDLRDVILVGHSYGGMVIAGVAERLPDRIAQLVFFDALVPRDGESADDIFRRLSGDRPATDPAVVARPVPDGDFGIDDPDLLAWARAKLTPQPVAPAAQPVRQTTASASIPRSFIACTAGWRGPFAQLASEARAAGWPVYSLPTGHDGMITLPREAADLLHRVATLRTVD